MNDITTQSSENYTYDDNGNLTQDNAERIKIEWNAYGKVAKVEKYVTSSFTTLLESTEFMYDAAGNRIMKVVNPNPGAPTAALPLITLEMLRVM